MALVRPILTYPIIPTVCGSYAQLKQLQRIQNEALRWVTRKYYRTRDIIQNIHSELDIPPINIYLQTQARKIWRRLEEELTEQEYRDITRIEENFQENSRFQRSFPIINTEMDPIY